MTERALNMTPQTQRTVMKWLQMSLNVENQSTWSSWSLVELAADLLEVKFCQVLLSMFVTLEDVMSGWCALPYWKDKKGVRMCCLGFRRFFLKETRSVKAIAVGLTTRVSSILLQVVVPYERYYSHQWPSLEPLWFKLPIQHNHYGGSEPSDRLSLLVINITIIITEGTFIITEGFIENFEYRASLIRTICD